MDADIRTMRQPHVAMRFRIGQSTVSSISWRET
jgi:hypothetical protein